MRIRLCILVLLPFMLISLSNVAAQEHEGKTIVKPQLVADTKAIEPGKPFTVGIHFQMELGWHLYWENSGDGGLPISVKWALPQGFKVSPLRWPTPIRFEEEGDLTSYGYANETMLLVRVTPPKSLSDASVTLAADLSWLVCEALCIPGDAKVNLILPVAAVAKSPEAGLIAQFEKKVPKPATASPFQIKSAVAAKQADDDWLIRIELQSKGRALKEFFPRVMRNFTISHSGLKVQGNSIIMPVIAVETGAIPKSVSGVVTSDQGAFEIRVPLDTSAIEGAASAPDQDTAGTTAANPETSGLETQPDDADGEAAAVSESEAAASSTAAGFSSSSGDWLNAPFQVAGQDSQSLPFASIILLALFGGMLLNVMPCVLPILSLKILGFVQHAGESQRRTRLLGVWFAAGVLVSFWILALSVIALRATGEQIGWGFQFQSPVFVVAMSAVVLVFALNLFGVFEITGPSIQSGVLQKEGIAGAFFNGVLATTLATPCSAPFLGTALGFAFAQPAAQIMLIFTAVAIGMALPYVILSWNPRWLKFVPRPGMWMVRLKQGMGFLLVGTVIWLLSVLGSQMGSEGIVWTCVFLLAVAVSVWMIGHLDLNAPRRHRVLTWSASFVLVGLAYFWAFERELQWRQEGQVSANVVSVAKASGHINWVPFSLDDVGRRVRNGETVFIDFTADWCWTCKVNERTVLETDSDRQQLRTLNVTPIKADWTNRNQEITQLLAKFGRSGVPFYVIFPAGKLSEPIALSEVITPSSVIEALKAAGPSSK